MTGGTFTRHDSENPAFGYRELVKNADENGPTATRAFAEVIAAHPRVESG
ncbi:hypothetical protein GCM10010320_49240 [Streptomyces caelestis]|nr:hypothetical protein GCM10010320_49240 [Streptomyces caelestis]